MSERSGLSAAVGFLTTLGGASAPSATALLWFPAVGLALGAANSLAAVGIIAHWNFLVAGVLVVVVDLVLTGLLHYDGLADAADGLLPPFGDRQRRLDVMSDPTTGAFGVVAVVAVFGVRSAAMVTIVLQFDGDAIHHPWATTSLVAMFCGVWCLSRSLMALAAVTVPYARTAGLATAFLPEVDGRWRVAAAAVAGLLVALVLSFAVIENVGGTAAALLAGVVAFGGVIGFSHRRIGGFTGDVLGAAGVIAETTALVGISSFIA